MVCKESDEDRCCDGSVEVDYGVIALEEYSWLAVYSGGKVFRLKRSGRVALMGGSW